MSIVSMQKIRVIGMDRDRDSLMKNLMDLGAVEIPMRRQGDAENLTSLLTDKDSEEIQKFDQKISDAELALETLEKYSPEKRPLIFTRREMKRKNFEEVLTDSDTIQQNVNVILGLHTKLHDLNEERNRAMSELVSLTPWENYGAPLELSETKQCHLELGILPQGNLESLKEKLQAEGDAWVVETISEDKSYQYLLFVCLQSEFTGYREVLKQSGWTETRFADLKGTVAESEAEIRNRMEDLQAQIVETEKEITGRYLDKAGVECYHDALMMQRDQIAIKGNLSHTERTFYFEGWVPVPAVKKVQKCLDSAGCYYELTEPEEDDEVPVLTQAGRFVYPFEVVTSMYSLPDYHGIDPTKYFAVFYALFFGMMLSDAGYGIVITVATAVLLKKYKLEGSMYQMIKMFFYCGISTIFWGAMFGGWFGNSVQVISGTFFGKEVILKPIWFDPIQDPTRLLIFSLCFGVVHLFVAMALNCYMLFRDGHGIDAILDVFPWYMIIGGAGLYLVTGGTVQKVMMGLVIAGAVVLLLTGGRKKKGIGKIIGGFGAIYNVTSYMSDILSYARLLALGLATGVIAQVINTIGSLFGGGVKGAILMILIFIVGHVMNLLINALGAFVHSSRLQYIEFFGKFYMDGGEPFDPFRNKTKYVRFTEESINGGN